MCLKFWIDNIYIYKYILCPIVFVPKIARLIFSDVVIFHNKFAVKVTNVSEMIAKK